jgi:hypothetical protein
VLPTMAGSMEQVCVCVQGYYFEADKVSVVICPTITVLHHISRNFLTARRMSQLEADVDLYNLVLIGVIICLSL